MPQASENGIPAQASTEPVADVAPETTANAEVELTSDAAVEAPEKPTAEAGKTSAQAGKTAAQAGKTARRGGKRRAKPTHLITAALLGGLFGLIITVVALMVIYGEKLPRIGRAQYTEAFERWETSGIADYDLRVEVKLQQPTVYDVHVRRGLVVEVKSGGRSLKRAHAFETWSVAGMFETIKTDLDRLDSPNPQVIDGKECRVLLKGVFDAQYGFPSQVLRIETREKGTNPEVAWRVMSFEVATPVATDAN